MDLFDREQYVAFHGKQPPPEWREAIPADVLRAAGGICPDIIFSSPPCKGFSGLLPSASAGSEKYQALNRLTARAVRLTLEAFAHDLPAVFLIENVPRIRTRGAELLEEIKRLLRGHGYRVTDSDHDCGEIGGLGQRRKRYLMIARNPKKLAPFIYQPPKRPLKTIGDVIGPLALPDDPSLGPMHRLPRLKWLTWLRLALIPAGGDWRDLQKITPEEYRIVRDEKNFNGSPGLYGVNAWDEPAKAVTGGMRVPCSNTPAAIADPRLPDSKGVYPNRFRVNRFDEPAPTITGDTDVQCGAQSIGDPRLTATKPIFNHAYKVTRSDEPAGTVTSGGRPSNGGTCIADVRLKHDPRPGVYRILRMDEASPAVTGGAGVGTSNGPQAVADHRLGCCPRGNTKGPMGVQEWEKPAATVFGSLDVHSGPGAVSDPRIPGNNERPDPPPVIVALDGTWHRPLTTLELLALQSFPVRFSNGTPVVLAGKSDSRWRERVGNAVPPDASRGIHEQILLAMVQHVTGETFVMGSTDIWVRREEARRLIVGRI
jgi:site-specific DNA-cytosine methylase